jgi:hypothetical protein
MSTSSPRSYAPGGPPRLNNSSGASVISASALSAARHDVHQHTRVADASKLDQLLRLPRRTPSVRSALERTAAGGGGGGGSGGEVDADAVLQRLFARLALSCGALEGGVVRALVHERMAVLARLHAETERLEAAAAAGAQPGAGADAELLGYLRAAAAANARELRRRIGGPAAEEIFVALRTPEVRAAYALAVPSEEAAMAEAEAEAAELAEAEGADGGASAATGAAGAGSAAERAARIWRRKLSALASTFKSAGGAIASHGSPRYITHDSRTHLGHRSLSNDLNMRSEKDRMSYFQLAQHKYGKGWVDMRDREGEMRGACEKPDAAFMRVRKLRGSEALAQPLRRPQCCGPWLTYPIPLPPLIPPSLFSPRRRRGSTSIAGAWEDVFDERGNVRPGASENASSAAAAAAYGEARRGGGDAWAAAYGDGSSPSAASAAYGGGGSSGGGGGAGGGSGGSMGRDGAGDFLSPSAQAEASHAAVHAAKMQQLQQLLSELGMTSPAQPQPPRLATAPSPPSQLQPPPPPPPPPAERPSALAAQLAALSGLSLSAATQSQSAPSPAPPASAAAPPAAVQAQASPAQLAALAAQIAALLQKSGI